MSEELEKAIADAASAAEAEVTGGTVDKVEEETVDSTKTEDKTVDTTVEDKPERERDESGKFKPKAADEKAVDKDEDDDEDPLSLSAEQLSRINANPDLLAVYKSMQRGLTKKTTGIAET